MLKTNQLRWEIALALIVWLKFEARELFRKSTLWWTKAPILAIEAQIQKLWSERQLLRISRLPALDKQNQSRWKHATGNQILFLSLEGSHGHAYSVKPLNFLSLKHRTKATFFFFFELFFCSSPFKRIQWKVVYTFMGKDTERLIHIQKLDWNHLGTDQGILPLKSQIGFSP